MDDHLFTSLALAVAVGSDLGTVFPDRAFLVDREALAYPFLRRYKTP